MKYMRKGGWYSESHRHYLAAKGIKTSLMSRGGDMLKNSFTFGEKMSITNAAKEGEKTIPWIKHAGESSMGVAEQTPDTVMDSVELSGERGVEKVHHTATHYLARTIGAKQVAEVKRLTNEAEANGIVSIPEVQDYVKDRLGDEVLDSWEGADMEVNRIVAEEVMKPTKYDAKKEKFEIWPKYSHVPEVKTPKQVYEFEEKTGRRHEGEPWSHYLNREVTDDE